MHVIFALNDAKYDITDKSCKSWTALLELTLYCDKKNKGTRYKEELFLELFYWKRREKIVFFLVIMNKGI